MDRIILFGTSKRAMAVQDAILKSDHRFCQVVTEAADVNSEEFVEHIKTFDPNLFIVCGYPKIFRRPLLDVPRYGTWNCHAGPVPEYRGGSPLNWQIIDGRRLLGVSLLQMDEGIDTGPVISSRFFRLGKDETIRDAHRKANRKFADMVIEALDNFPPKPKPQPESSAYRKQRSDDDGRVNLHWGAERIHNFVRALTHPYPGAWIDTPSGRIRIWKTSLD